MIRIRSPESIHRARGTIENGTFEGRWHFSFDQYRDAAHERFGTLRVFNDDTLSPGAVWPLHPHREIEVVTYCAAGEFRHADEHGEGGLLKPGWVQHTTVGRGMWHSEINHRSDAPMRFIQMWFLPTAPGLEPAVQQREVRPEERTDCFLPLVSANHAGALPIASRAAVFSCRLTAGRSAREALPAGWGAYLYVLEGGPIRVDGQTLPALGAAQVEGEAEVAVEAEEPAELLLVQVAPA